MQNSFASDFTKNAKLEDTKRGKGSNFLSFLAPGGGDGTWFRILEKKVVDASCYITLCQILNWCTIFPLSENVWQIIWFYLLAWLINIRVQYTAKTDWNNPVFSIISFTYRFLNIWSFQVHLCQYLCIFLKDCFNTECT